jgi:beta-glucanase (GH16 family)
LRRIILLVTVLLFSITLYACDLVLVPPTVTDDFTIYGIDDIEIALNTFFDPLEGVYATDAFGQDITDSIWITGLDALELEDGVTTKIGSFTLQYNAKDAFDSIIGYFRQVTVFFDENIDQNIPPHLRHCQNPYVGDYIISWCDEFDQTGSNFNSQGVNTDLWAFQTGTGSQYGLTGWGNNEQQFYLEQNAYIQNQRLVIEAKRELHEDMPYTSARLWTKPTFAQKYGRFEARIKLPIGQGLWPAFWLMPKDDVYGGWAASGEIDIMEAKGRFPNTASGAIHFGGAWPNNTYLHAEYHFPSGQNINQFHVYAIEWEEGEIRWYINDVLYQTRNQWHTEGHAFPAPFDQSFYVILNLAVGGTFDGGRIPPNELFNTPVIMEIDYVRVYQKIVSNT